MILNFINRNEELEFLKERYKRKNFEFFVVYGRRRVGKTELIKNFLKDKKAIYFLCDKSGTVRNIERFKKKIAEYLNEPIIASNDIEEVFSYFVKKIDERVILVFDEFSYLLEKDDAIPSIFQVICDELLKGKNIFLILCGSSISMMESGVLSSKSPLYGRKTGHIKLFPVRFKYFKDFFPDNPIEKNIEFYSILEGVPFYLEKFSDKKSVFDNVKEQILDKRGGLYEEVEFLLREELREPDVYKTILAAIASGKTKVVDIANKSGIKVQDINKYLKVLIRLGIIKKEKVITEKKDKRSLYLIDDNFFNFYFSFAEPYKSDLEIGELKNIKNKFERDFSTYVGRRFEKLIREEIVRKAELIEIERIGRWWGKIPNAPKGENECEIDIVALNEKNKEIIFGECKWEEKVNANSILNALIKKADCVDWNKGKRKEFYAVFAKSFSNKVDEFDGKNVHCFDLEDIGKILIKK